MREHRLAEEVRKNLRLFILLIGTGLAGGLTAIFQANYLTKIVNGAFLDGQGLAGLMQWLYALLFAIAGRAFFIWLGEVLGFRLAAKIRADLRQRVVEHLFHLGPVYAGKEQAGELVNTLVEGIESLEAYFAKYLPQLATAVLIPPVILTVVFSLDIVAAVIMLVTAPLIPVFMILIGRWASILHRRQWGVLSRLSGHFFDVLQGLTTLKIFNRSKEQVEVIARLSEQFRDSTLRVLKVAFLSALALELLATLSTAMVAVTVGLKLLYGKLVFSQAFFILLLAPEYYLPLRLLGSQFHAGLAGRTAAERIFGVLAAVKPFDGEAGTEPFLASDRIGINFKQVSFTYAAGLSPALTSVSFTIEPGERLALVGPSGAGKSTVADLLLGFIQPDSGIITINGRELTGIHRSDWLAHVAYVPQFPHLFFGTVRDNISFGLDGDALTLEEAAMAAGAHEFILRLSDGYDTVIGEGGVGLSGGEAQRIALARAFFKNAPLLILDEPTTGLDPHSEAIVRQALDRLMTGKSVLIIAHRLTTACQADRIIVLDRGMVAESGSNQQLYADKGLYHQLVTACRGVV